VLAGIVVVSGTGILYTGEGAKGCIPASVHLRWRNAVKALVLEDYGKLVYSDVADPEPETGELLIRVRACGICGSDVHGLDGSTGRRIPPIIMGHEGAGEIVHAGPGPGDFETGERVTFDSTISCGSCAYCRSGMINLCDRRRVLGVSCAEYRQNGIFSELVSLPRRIIYRLPESVAFEHAALVEPMSVALHAVKRAPRPVDGTAAVVGAGIIGLLIVQLLGRAGFSAVFAVDTAQDRLEVALAAGAHAGINPGRTEVQPELLRLTGGRGVDVAFEAVGIPQTVKTALHAVRKGGAVVLVGNISPEVSLHLQHAVTREITLFGSCASAGEYHQCIDMIAGGRVDVGDLISATAPLSEGARQFERLYGGEAGLLKVILKP
jgi:L-iditol 2-dehydrogenase